MLCYLYCFSVHNWIWTRSYMECMIFFGCLLSTQTAIPIHPHFPTARTPFPPIIVPCCILQLCIHCIWRQMQRRIQANPYWNAMLISFHIMCVCLVSICVCDMPFSVQRLSLRHFDFTYANAFYSCDGMLSSLSAFDSIHRQLWHCLYTRCLFEKEKQNRKAASEKKMLAICWRKRVVWSNISDGFGIKQKIPVLSYLWNVCVYSNGGSSMLVYLDVCTFSYLSWTVCERFYSYVFGCV